MLKIHTISDLRFLKNKLAPISLENSAEILVEDEESSVNANFPSIDEESFDNRGIRRNLSEVYSLTNDSEKESFIEKKNELFKNVSEYPKNYEKNYIMKNELPTSSIEKCNFLASKNIFSYKEKKSVRFVTPEESRERKGRMKELILFKNGYVKAEYDSEYQE